MCGLPYWYHRFSVETFIDWFPLVGVTMLTAINFYIAYITYKLLKISITLLKETIIIRKETILIRKISAGVQDKL